MAIGILILFTTFCPVLVFWYLCKCTYKEPLLTAMVLYIVLACLLMWLDSYFRGVM